MKPPRFATLLLALTVACTSVLANPHAAAGNRIAVAGGGPASVEAGMGILRQGGNAADAAVALMLVQTVTESQHFCFGGEMVALAYSPKTRTTESILGFGEAPALATREYFAAKGGIPAAFPSIESAAVPGAFGGFLTLLERHGRLSFGEVAQPAIELLATGNEAWRPALRRTLQKMVAAEQGGGTRAEKLNRVRDFFYRGEVARSIDAWARANGSPLRYEDFARHTTPVEKPVSAAFGEYTVVKPGPGTQGPALLQALRLLDPAALRALEPGADRIHLEVEAIKLAFADRDAFYGDPSFVATPLGRLLSDEYTRARRQLIDPRHASLEWRPGHALLRLPAAAIPGPVTRPVSATSDTTTCIVVDQDRNIVVATPSGWGGVPAGESGVLLGSRLRSFNTWAGHPNCIAPGKRPRITLTPTLVFVKEQPVLGVSVEGGDWQDQAALQVVLNALVYDMPVAQAVSQPRWGTRHHVGSFDEKPVVPGSLEIPAEMGDAVPAQLKQLGHRVSPTTEIVGRPVAVRLDGRDGALEVAGDPKGNRHVAAE